MTTPLPVRCCQALMFTVAVSLSPCPPALAAPEQGMTASQQEAAFASATRAFRDGQFAAAYGRFVYLADRGHVESGRIAWMMQRYARPLFGTEWYATPQQLSTWAAWTSDASRGPEALAQSSSAD